MHEIMFTIEKWYLIGCVSSLVTYVIIQLFSTKETDKAFLRSMLFLFFFASWLGLVINVGVIYMIIKLEWRKRKFKKNIRNINNKFLSLTNENDKGTKD